MITPGYQFASDNTAGICPEALEAMQKANEAYAAGYGDDAHTDRAADALRKLFGTDCEVFFCFNGTAANSMAIAHLCRSYHSVICHEQAHIETDECGGPEFFCHGTKLLLARGEGGKMLPAAAEEIVTKRSDIHFPKPRVLSITNATELGTVYTVDEVAALGRLAKKAGLAVHMDGARFANACAALGVPPAEFTWKAGVDVLCFGATKNGMAVGEAVVFFNRELAEGFDFRCKQAGQLASKMRFMSAPFAAMLETGAWLRNAKNANGMARLLADRLSAIDGVRLIHPVLASAVFAEMPAAWLARLREKGWKFYTFIGTGGGRFMCSWKTTREEVDALVRDVQAVAG